jgi:hypothetical protein
MSAFWQTFADMGGVDGHELVIDCGEGIYVFDERAFRLGLDSVDS